MGGDDIRGKLPPDGDRAEQRLEDHETERAPGGNLGPLAGASGQQGPDRDDEDEEAEVGGDGAVGVFDDRLEFQGRVPLALAAGPVVGTAHTGVADPGDVAEHDQDEGAEDTGDGEAVEPGHRASLYEETSGQRSTIHRQHRAGTWVRRRWAAEAPRIDPSDRHSTPCRTGRQPSRGDPVNPVTKRP